MAVTFNAAGALAVNNTTVTLPVVAPTLSAGDLMICCLINKSVTANTISPPDGTWTTVRAQEINDCTTAADDHAFVIFAKFASAGDSGATFNFTKATDDNLLFAGVISAWTGAAGFDATPAARSLNAAAADAVTFPAYDPVVACHVIFVAFYGNDLTTFAAAMSSDTNPDCTVRFDLETATGNDATIACTSGDNTDGANIASRTWASVSTTDAGSTGVVFGVVAGISVGASEDLKISGSGRVDLIDLLAPRLHLTDGPVVAALTGGANLSATLTSESLKVSDAATVQLTPLLASVSEAARVTDSVTAREDPLQASLTDGLRVSDAVSSTLTPLHASSTEALKIADAVSASLGALLVVASESLELSDVVLPTLDPLRATPSESLRVVDGPASASLGTLVVSLVESSRLSDSVSSSTTPLMAVVSAESLRLIDLNQGAIEIEHVIRISDGPVVATLVSGVYSASLSESVRLTDTIAATITPVFVTITESVKVTDGPLSASLGNLPASVGPESLRVSDSVSVTLNPLNTTQTEPLRVSDAATLTLDPLNAIPSDAVRVSDSAAASLGTLLATASEGLRITDSLATVLNPLQSALSEALVVVDQAATTLDPLATAATEVLSVVDGPPAVVMLEPGILSASLSESILLRDANQGLVQLYGVLHITDGPVIAQFDDAMSVSVTESLKVSDTVTARREPLEVVIAESMRLALDTASAVELVQPEALKLGDTVNASLGSADLQAASIESLKISDEIATSLTPLIVSASESIRLEDLVTALQGLSATLAESLRLSDTVSVSATPLHASPNTEALAVSDTPFVSLTPLQTATTEALIVADQPAESNLGQLERAITPDALRLTDTLSAALDRLDVDLTDALRITETLTASTGLLQAAPNSEGLNVSDSVLTSLTPLRATLGAESLTLTDGPVAAQYAQLSRALGADSLRLTDTLSVTLDPLEANRTESVRITDILVAQSGLSVTLSESIRLFDPVTTTLNPLHATPSESVRVTDVVAAGVDLLSVSLTEAVYCQDVASVSFILTHPREFFIVPAQDRWFVVEAQDRWFVVDAQDRWFIVDGDA